MELISPRSLTGAQELKQELFLRAEELERLVAIYKIKLCGEEMASMNYGSKLEPSMNYGSKLEQSNTEDLRDQRGQFYDIYMRKREEKMREEWRARGVEKEAEMRAMIEGLDCTSSTMMSKGKATESRNDHSRLTNSRKLSSNSSKPSSTSQSSVTTTHTPTIRSSNSASLIKENTKESSGISVESTLQRSVARSQSSNERMRLVKDIKARRSQSLRKNSASLGEPKDFMHLNCNPLNSTPPMIANLPRSGAPKPLLRKSNGTGPTAGLSTAKLRNYMASQAPISVENKLQESTEMLNEGNEQSESRIEDARKLRFSKESWNSAHHRFQSNSQIVESPKSRNCHMQNFLSHVHKASDSDSPVPCFDPATGYSHNMNSNLEGKTVRLRKRWGSVERPFVAVDDSTNSIMDVTKGIKRFLKFGNRSRGIEIHNDKEDDRDSENFSFENSKNSSIGQIPSFGSFNEDETLYEQGNRLHNSSHFASLKEKEKYLLASFPKQRVLSSLPPFHVRENENKSR